MSKVISSIWEDELQAELEENGIALSDVTVHVLKDGLLWDNPEGFRKRLEGHIKQMGKAPDASLNKIRVSTVCMSHLDWPTKDTHVYFVIGINDGSKPELLQPRPSQGSDLKLGPLPTAEYIHRHALDHVRDAKHSPSHAAHLKIYAKRQEEDRHYMTIEKNTRDVPVTLHSPSFALFQTLAEDGSFVPSAKFLHLTYQFMRKSTAIYLKGQERPEELSELLSDVFGRNVLDLKIGRANPDGSVIFDLVYEKGECQVHELVPLAVIEYKVEPGSGGCDAGVQALAAVEQFWQSDAHVSVAPL
ncbi:hypothetical protein L227DRAFT_58456 [Lentinus tigrinus ALCF2SS1-6]|uniref:Uncharacterized protein n=1 Tax=Lentinus tigrinus ALCF2SS1-6 TaxID=1328759 RepID=A0A5C2SD05_9APHY|nr:hypothetical protein L227DRAFT_58456 [Lentinus tigrinus ALCF2SS1-6]